MRRQFLAETRDSLKRMMRVLNVREAVSVTLDVVTDMAYAWEAINDYTPLMRSRIEKEPLLAPRASQLTGGFY